MTHRSTRNQHRHFIELQTRNSLRYSSGNQVSPHTNTNLAHVKRNNIDIQQTIRVLRVDELPLNHVDLTSQIFPKKIKYKESLDALDDSLYRKFYNHLGNGTHKQLLEPEAAAANNFKILPRDPGSCKCCMPSTNGTAHLTLLNNFNFLSIFAETVLKQFVTR